MRRRELLATLLSIPSLGQGGGRQVYIQNVGERTATVRWNGAAGEIRYSTEDEAMRTVWGNATAAGAEARLTGLTPGREYRYDIDGRSGAFRTAGPGRVEFLVIGDTGTGSAEQAALGDRLVRERAHFLLHTGDVAYPTGQAQTYARHYADYYHALMATTPFFPCPGNHDYYETQAEPYFAFHDLPSEEVPAAEKGRYYAFEWGDATVISLDSNDPLLEPERRKLMTEWLERKLISSNRFWRIVYFHHPPYAGGPNEADALTALAREHLAPILERHRVPLVFGGHEHSYQRSVPVGAAETTYITSGGGGAGLYPVHATRWLAKGVSAHHYLRAELEGYQMDVTAIGVDGTALDRVRLRPRPMIRGVGNAASFTTRIGTGSAVSVFGWQLGIAGTEMVTMRANGARMEVIAVTPGQVNALMPGGVTGRVRLEIVTPNGAGEMEVEVLPVAPALFGTVLRTGSQVVVFATGLSGWTGGVSAQLGGQTIPCRLTEGTVPGIYQVEFTWSGGQRELRIVAGSETSNSVLVPAS